MTDEMIEEIPVFVKKRSPDFEAVITIRVESQPMDDESIDDWKRDLIDDLTARVGREIRGIDDFGEFEVEIKDQRSTIY